MWIPRYINFVHIALASLTAYDDFNLLNKSAP
jgi:hypothetical protein